MCENHARKDGKENKKAAEEVLNLWTPYIPEKPSRILCGFHAKEEGKFWLSLVSMFTVSNSSCLCSCCMVFLCLFSSQLKTVIKMF